MKFYFNQDFDFAMLGFGSSEIALPCKPSGASPFLHIDISRITGSIFTGPNIHYYRFCGLASTKPKSDSSAIRRRVDRSSTKSTTKGKRISLLPNLSFLSSLFYLSSIQLSSIQRSHLERLTGNGIYG